MRVNQRAFSRATAACATRRLQQMTGIVRQRAAAVGKAEQPEEFAAAAAETGNAEVLPPQLARQRVPEQFGGGAGDDGFGVLAGDVGERNVQPAVRGRVMARARIVQHHGVEMLALHEGKRGRARPEHGGGADGEPFHELRQAHGGVQLQRGSHQVFRAPAMLIGGVQVLRRFQDHGRFGGQRRGAVQIFGGDIAAIAALQQSDNPQRLAVGAQQRNDQALQRGQRGEWLGDALGPLAYFGGPEGLIHRLDSALEHDRKPGADRMRLAVFRHVADFIGAGFGQGNEGPVKTEKFGRPQDEALQVFVQHFRAPALQCGGALGRSRGQRYRLFSSLHGRGCWCWSSLRENHGISI